MPKHRPVPNAAVAPPSAWPSSLERYQSIVQNAVEGIFQSTPDGHYLLANPALARMYGSALATGMTVDWVESWPDRIRAVTADQVQAAGAKLGPDTQRVLQLVGELRGNDMTGATRTCEALGWAYCEPANLLAMRKALEE